MSRKHRKVHPVLFLTVTAFALDSQMPCFSLKITGFWGHVGHTCNVCSVRYIVRRRGKLSVASSFNMIIFEASTWLKAWEYHQLTRRAERMRTGQGVRPSVCPWAPLGILDLLICYRWSQKDYRTDVESRLIFEHWSPVNRTAECLLGQLLLGLVSKHALFLRSGLASGVQGR